MEADESAKNAAVEEHNSHIKKQPEPSIGLEEVQQAKLMAKQMNEQLQKGVEEAENR